MIDLQKQSLRTRMRELAARRPSQPFSPVLSELARHDLFRKASSILLFAPLPGEPDPRSLIESLPGRNFLFPRIEGEELALYLKTPDSIWKTGPYGLREPDPSTWERRNPDTIEIALIPGLAFDASGGRLGRGKGYYDRLLGDSGFHGMKVGICMEWQLVKLVPCASHDIRMDLVVTGGKIHDPGSLLDIPGERG
jgi:5-formyltetrahydrofolate cyclo-ligase